MKDFQKNIAGQFCKKQFGFYRLDHAFTIITHLITDFAFSNALKTESREEQNNLLVFLVYELLDIPIWEYVKVFFYENIMPSAYIEFESFLTHNKFNVLLWSE